MKKILIATSLLASSLLLFADPPRKAKVDFDSASAPALEVYQRNVKTLEVTLVNRNASLDSTGNQPAFYFFQGSTCTTCTATWADVSNSVMTVSMTSNQLANAGTYTYGAGTTNSAGVTIASRGNFQISRDPNH